MGILGDKMLAAGIVSNEDSARVKRQITVEKERERKKKEQELKKSREHQRRFRESFDKFQNESKELSASLATFALIGSLFRESIEDKLKKDK